MKAKNICKYIIYALIMGIFAYGEGKLRVQGIAVAFYLALLYNKQNLLITGPIYVALAFLKGFSWQSLIVGVVPVAVALLAMIIHYKLKRPVKLPWLFLYAFLASVPRAVFCGGEIGDIIACVLGFATTEVALFAFVLTVKVVVGKGLRFVLSFEERAAIALAFFIFGGELCVLKIAWFTPLYLCMMLCALGLNRISPTHCGAMVISMGFGGFVLFGEPIALEVGALIGLTSALLAREKLYVTAPALLGIFAIAMPLLEGSDFEWLSLIPVGGGYLIEAPLLFKFGSRLDRFKICFGTGMAVKSVSNRDRASLATRLKGMSAAFYEISQSLGQGHNEPSIDGVIPKVTAEAVRRACSGCIYEKSCGEVFGGSVEPLISELVTASLERGRATILDTPPFLSANCKRVAKVIAVVDELIQLRETRKQEAEVVATEQTALGRELWSMGKLLDELSEEFEKRRDFDNALEIRVIEELALAGVGSSDVAVYKGKNGIQVSLVATDSDACGKPLIAAVSRALGTKMEVASKVKATGGTTALTLEEEPRYKVMFGERYVSEGVGEVRDCPSGDRISVFRVAGCRVMAVLSDGMGTGREASASSGVCVSLLENLCRVGFDIDVASDITAGMLSLRDKDDFNALDVGILDTRNGEIDFFKLGGRESYILTEQGLAKVDCGSLPLGAIEGSKPYTEKVSLGDDTLILMLSDGVADVLGWDEMTALSKNLLLLNPDLVADNVMDEFLNITGDSAHDDASVLAIRVVKR